jgi:cell division protease FtsH
LANSNKKPETEERDPLSALRRSGCRPWVFALWLMLVLALSPWVARQLGFGATTQEISYSVFRKEVVRGNVVQITVSGEEITGELDEPASVELEEGQSNTYTRFVTYLPSFGDDELLSLLETHAVEVRTEPELAFSWGSLLLNLLPWVFLLGVGYIFVRRMQAQGQSIFSMQQSQAKLYDRREEGTTFDDVAGADAAKTELVEIVEFLKNPDRFQRLGGEMPRGYLLVGPPGTGKTLLARAVAGEAEVPFFSITGSDFMEMFVGVGASRVRNLFQEAKDTAPSIIFIDELDSIGRRRGAGLGGGHDEREQTLNQLLSELDGFETNEGVIVMAATNRPDILDPALLRPGRFDRRITVDRPTKDSRMAILKIHARGKPLGDDVDLERIARGTPGFSGADLENLLNEAALLAARRDADQIEGEDIEEARDKILMGLERENMALTDEECKMLAVHESGHAITAVVLPHADPVHKVTIVPRGQAMGVTQQLPEGDRYVYSREYLLDRLAVMMGGRAAEILVFDTATSGAADDLKQATRLARRMVLSWGMSKRLQHMALDEQREQVFLGEEIAQRRDFSEATAELVDDEIQKILSQAFVRATEVLTEHRKGLDKLTAMLIEHEELSGERVVELIETLD